MGAALRIEVQSVLPDKRLAGRCRDARNFLGVALDDLEEIKVYKIVGDLAPEQLNEVFIDPVLQRLHADTDRHPAFVAEIQFRPGVTDNPARAAEEALAVVGVRATVSSGSLFFLFGDISADGARKVASELLANDLIQKADIWTFAAFRQLERFKNVTLPTVSLSAVPHVEGISLERDDAGLEILSKDRCLALTVAELKHVRDFYRAQKRTPTDVELEIIAQSWSEHCKHKIFGAKIDYTGPDGKKMSIDSLYKTYIKRATREIEAERGLAWLVSVFSDNAGIVRFDDTVDLCIKVETHNSPSALDPYGGALTGILGVNRDIMGAGLGGRPVANMDVFCFAPPSMPEAGEESFMPAGVKPPRRILEGVHKGVEDGGNKSGIPTVNGAFFFDRDYAGKPLVFVGTVGVIPQGMHEKSVSPGDRIVMVGGAIGADGVHGATFSSLEMDENAPATAVQIGDPMMQKRAMDFLLEARDKALYKAITDNGAGGLSSSVGEMAEMTGGAEIDLALCPVKYPGLSPWELMVSESQERMTVAVPEDKMAAFRALARRRGVMATDLGLFTDSGMLTVRYGRQQVAELSLDFLHRSLPPLQVRAEWTAAKPRAAWSLTTQIVDRRQELPDTPLKALLPLLQSPNITSKEKLVRAYDHEVQAATHVKPFIGKESDGPADAGVIWLRPHGGGEDNAVAIACGLAPRVSLVDPYLMAQFAVDEAMRNIVVSGGDPDMCCLLDNFCWPDPVASEKNAAGVYRMGQLVRACQGLYDACKAYGTPLVSGKDSMKNDFRGKDRRGENIGIGVLPTLLVTAMARATTGRAVGSDFKAAGDLIYLLGVAGSGLAQSELSYVFKTDDDALPSIDLAGNGRLYRCLHQALIAGLLRSAHDLSEGGLLVAVAESMIGGRLGAALVMQDSFDACFNEAPGRLLVSVSPAGKAAFEQRFSACGMLLLGQVSHEPTLAVNGESLPLADIVAAWQRGV